VVIVSVLGFWMGIARPDCLSLTLFNKKGPVEPPFLKKS